MTSAQTTPARPEHVLIKPWLPSGVTQSGIVLEHKDDIPRIFGDVIAVGEESRSRGVAPGQRIVFERYAGERITLDDGEFEMLHIDDICAIIE